MTVPNPQPVDPVKARRAFVAEFMRRLAEPGVCIPTQNVIEAAWDAGFNSGARQEERNGT
jgi:hypothetical protein